MLHSWGCPSQGGHYGISSRRGEEQPRPPAPGTRSPPCPGLSRAPSSIPWERHQGAGGAELHPGLGFFAPEGDVLCSEATGESPGGPRRGAGGRRCWASRRWHGPSGSSWQCPPSAWPLICMNAMLMNMKGETQGRDSRSSWWGSRCLQPQPLVPVPPQTEPTAAPLQQLVPVPWGQGLGTGSAQPTRYTGAVNWDFPRELQEEGGRSQSDWGTRCHPGCPPTAPRGVPEQAAARGAGGQAGMGCGVSPHPKGTGGLL